MHESLRVPVGKRIFVTGRTGSGKTQGVIFLAEHRKDAVIIIDTKIEEKFPQMPRSHIFDGLSSVDFKSVHKKYKKGALQYFIVRPAPDEMDTEVLDDFIHSLYDGCRDCTIVLDELYSFTGNSGKPGPGLTALYTRGRSRGLTTIGCAQRPSWVPVFCMSESDYFMVYDLTWPKDKERMAYMGLGDFAYKTLDKYHFLWYNVSDNETSEFAPVPIRKTTTTPDRANTGEMRAVKWLT